MSLSLRLTRRLKFPSYWPDVGVNPLKPRERLSPTPYTAEKISGPRTFVANKILHTGPNKWSQVCAGSLLSSGRTLQTDLAIKIFVPVLFPLTNDIPDTVSDDSFRGTDELMAWTEMYAYSRLSPLQGTVIPRVKGAFLIQAPDSSLEQIAIIMEHIHGQFIVDRCQELGSGVDGDRRWYPIVLDLLRKVYQIHKHGIVGLDIENRNILVVDDDSTGQNTPSVRLLDFAFSRPSGFGNEEDDIRHWVLWEGTRDIVDLMNLLAEICGGKHARSAYLKDHGYPERAEKRLWAFLDWAREEHSHDLWIASWWQVLVRCGELRKQDAGA